MNRHDWSRAGPVERERLLHRLADLNDAHANSFGAVETIDINVPLWFSQNLDVVCAAGTLRCFSGWLIKLTGGTLELGAPPGHGQVMRFTRPEPVGTVGALILWNAPFMLAA